MAKNKIIRIRVTHEEHGEIGRLADSRRVTMSDFVRQRIFEKLTLPVATANDTEENVATPKEKSFVCLLKGVKK